MQRQMRLQRKTGNGSAFEAVRPVIYDVLNSPGQPLDRGTRTFFEPRFGHDFSRVRIHSDDEAAQSAHALSALAYTVGHHVVFGPGQYAPGTRTGDRLIAHELSHVLQQRRSTASGSIELMNSPVHEAEADRIASGAIGHANHSSLSAVGGERQPPSKRLRPDQQIEATAEKERASVSSPNNTRQRKPQLAALPTAAPQNLHHAPGNVIQRTVAGDIAGGIVGAGVGAGIGALAGGPVGAVIGGLLGGLVGLALGDILSADKRDLTQGERQEAKLVFGTSLNYNSVKVADATLLSRLTSGNAVTPFETIYFPSGAFAKDYSPSLNGMAWLIHELTHAWQYQHGVSVLEKAFVAAHGASAYKYGGEGALRSAAAQGRRFTSFNTEQQGDILRNYYEALKNNADTSAYDPFVAEVQSGGSARGVLNDRNLRVTSPTSAVA